MTEREAPTLRDDARAQDAAPRVAIVVPAYNPASDELRKTIDSLLRQTMPVDTILVDDGSFEPVAWEGQRGERISVLRRRANGGITAALVDGVEAALSAGYEFVGRLDVGDVAYPARFEKQVLHLRRHPDISLVGAFSQVVDPGGHRLHLHGVNGGPEAVASYLFANAPFKHSTFLMRAEALRRLGSYDQRFDAAEDYELLLRFARAGRVDCLEEVLIDYVDDPKGISTRRRAAQLRARLRAQLAHARLTNPRWYLGVARALATIIVPSRLAKRISISIWRR